VKPFAHQWLLHQPDHVLFDFLQLLLFYQLHVERPGLHPDGKEIF
jgi:hypothetical protein